jgi:hypothetical protein
MGDVVVKLTYERGSATPRVVEECLDALVAQVRAGRLEPAEPADTAGRNAAALDLRGVPEPALADVDLGSLTVEVGESSAGYNAGAADIVISLGLQIAGGVASGVATAALLDLWHRLLHPTLAGRLPKDKQLGTARDPGLEATAAPRPSPPRDERGR